MPTVEVRRRQQTPSDLQSLESKIIAQRNEYAPWDAPEYEHIYIGFVETGVENLLEVLAEEVESYRGLYPEASFTLEYHPSCITHSEYPFQVYSFTLIKKVQTPEGQRRQLIIMSWKVPHQDNYQAENAAIERFILEKKIQPYDDGSGVPCRIEPASGEQVIHYVA